MRLIFTLVILQHLEANHHLNIRPVILRAEQNANLLLRVLCVSVFKPVFNQLEIKSNKIIVP